MCLQIINTKKLVSDRKYQVKKETVLYLHKELFINPEILNPQILNH